MTNNASAFLFAVCLTSLTAFADEATAELSPPPSPPAQSQPGYRPPSPRLGYDAPRRVKYGGGPIPSYAHFETSPRLGLVISGAAVLGGAYLISVLAAIGYCGPGSSCINGALYIPLIGPFIVAAQAPSSGGATLAIFDGVVQLTGLGLLIAGFAAPEKFVVWQDADAHASLTVVPGGGGGVGLALKY